MKLVSWNVNGIRAICKKGFGGWFEQVNADIICLQEVKAAKEQIPKLVRELGYYRYLAVAQKKGYSGVMMLTREEPLSVEYAMGIEHFDSEGRTVFAHFKDFTLCNVYFPSGSSSQVRVEYKLQFYRAFLDHITAMKKKQKRIIICGDVNTAHNAIDLARPKENEQSSGFLPEERAWIDELLASGFADTFRMFNSDGEHYTWWDYKTRARERNVGWRLDYFFVSEALRSKVQSAFISSEVMGSDHCPVGIELNR